MRFLVILIIIVVLVAIAAWQSGQRGYEQGFTAGYDPEHAQVLALQKRIDDQQTCINQFRARPRPHLSAGFPSQNASFIVGYVVRNVSHCDEASGFAALTESETMSFLPSQP